MIVEVTPVEKACHRCGGELYLTATVPHPSLPGSRLLPLCPRCDADDPAAHGVLAFFAAYGRVDLDTYPQLLQLVEEWIAAKQAQPTEISADQMADEAESLRRDGDWR